jgi:hypothetical protein
MSNAAGKEGQDLVWEKVLEPDEVPEGRVRAVTCHLATVCMSCFEGEYVALDNKCPHQGGRSVRGRSRTDGCAVRGTDGTSTPPRGSRPAVSTTESRPFPWRCGMTGSTSDFRRKPRPKEPSPISWLRRWSTGASSTFGAWSDIPTSASRMHCASRRRRVASSTTGSATRAQPHSR